MALRRVLLSVLATLLPAAPVLAAGQEAMPAPPPPPGHTATGPGGAEQALSHVRATSFARLLSDRILPHTARPAPPIPAGC